MNWNPLFNEGLRIKVDSWSSNWKIRIYSSDGHFEPRVILARIMLFWIGKKKIKWHHTIISYIILNRTAFPGSTFFSPSLLKVSTVSLHKCFLVTELSEYFLLTYMPLDYLVIHTASLWIHESLLFPLHPFIFYLFSLDFPFLFSFDIHNSIYLILENYAF